MVSANVTTVDLFLKPVLNFSKRNFEWYSHNRFLFLPKIIYIMEITRTDLFKIWRSYENKTKKSHSKLLDSFI